MINVNFLGCLVSGKEGGVLSEKRQGAGWREEVRVRIKERVGDRSADSLWRCVNFAPPSLPSSSFMTVTKTASRTTFEPPIHSFEIREKT